MEQNLLSFLKSFRQQPENAKNLLVQYSTRDPEKYLYFASLLLNEGLKKKKDPNAPKAQGTAFLIFRRDNASKLKKENPQATSTDITSKIRDMWTELSLEEKEKCQKIADKSREMYRACPPILPRNEWLDLCYWMIDEYPKQVERSEEHTVLDLRKEFFLALCKKRDPKEVKTFSEKYPDFELDMSSVEDELTIEFMLQNLCQEGYLDTLKWISKNCDVDNILSIHSAWQSKDMETIKWVFNRADPSDSEIFELISYQEYKPTLEMVEWLLDEYSFERSTYLDTALQTQDLETAEWLLKTYPDIEIDENDVLVDLCIAKKFDSAEWLLKRFPPKNFPVDEIYQELLEREDVETIRWFLEKFPETNV